MKNVAVIIAAYNVEKYIQRAIESALAQDYENKRVMVYSDGSTDNTEKMIREFGKDIDFVFDKENRGLSHARNSLIEAGKILGSDYFLILDGDDLFIDSEKITKMVKVAESAPKLIGAVYTDYENYKEATQEVNREYKRGFSRSELIKECILSDSGTMVSKLAYDKVGLYDEALRVGMDYDMWLRISESFLIYHLPENTTRVTIRSNSLSSSQDNKSLWQKNIKRVYEKLYERNSKA